MHICVIVIVHASTSFVSALISLTLYASIITVGNMSHLELEKGILSFYILIILCVIAPFLPGLESRFHFFKLLKLVFLPMPNATFLNNYINNNSNNSNTIANNSSSSSNNSSNSTGSNNNININNNASPKAVLLSPSSISGGSNNSSNITLINKSSSSSSSINNISSNNNSNSTAMYTSCVPFVEILLADALCSLSKVFKDAGTTIIVIYAFLTGTNITDYHYSGMVLVALLASLPFA